MLTRIEGGVTYEPQTFDVQNRLASANRVGTGTTTFAYDAAGIRVKTVHPGGKTSYFPFPGYEEEVNGSTTTRRITYAIAGQTVALRVQVVGGSNTLYYLHSDHLGSTSLATTTSGAVMAGSTARYLPFTGHRHNNLPGSDLGLVCMNNTKLHNRVNDRCFWAELAMALKSHAATLNMSIIVGNGDAKLPSHRCTFKSHTRLNTLSDMCNFPISHERGGSIYV